MATVLSNKDAALIDAYWRAANYLSVGQIYLFDNPLLREPLKEEHIKPRLLGHWGTTPGLNFIYAHLNRLIKKLDLDMIYVIGPGHGGPGIVANAYLEGTYSEVYPQHFAGRGGHEAPLHPVLVSWRNSEPCGARDARLDPRRRRTRLCAFARAWRGFRQSGLDRRLRRRRRGGRDGAARHELALQQVPQSRARRRRAADPAPQRLQDRQSDRARAHSARRARPSHARLRLPSAFRRRRRSRDNASADGEDARSRRQRHPPHSGGRTAQRFLQAPRLADDRHAYAKGLDLSQGDRRQAGRGLLALAPGADERDARPSRARPHPRDVDEELPAGGALRRNRTPRAGALGAPADREPTDERESARERRRAATRTEASQFQ